MSDFREESSPKDRAMTPIHSIDPGFVNHRLIETVLGEGGREVIDQQIRILSDLPEWMKRTRIGHIYTKTLLRFCEIHKIKSLTEVLSLKRGKLFCSTEWVYPCRDIYVAKRACSRIRLNGFGRLRAELHYSTSHITSDTTKAQLHGGAEVSIIGVQHRSSRDVHVFHPLVIGAPWLETEDPTWAGKIEWFSHDFYEHFIEDFDEFKKVRDTNKPSDISIMKEISEAAFKECLADILGDEVSQDWGGETSDHYSSHLHLNGRRTTGAFLLKGRAKFTPMTLNHLGKNNDQIVRMATEPAEVLVIQHCHEITSAVRATLRAFAVQPSRPRRYCLIDGRDSLWLLQAYGKVEKALALSKTKNRCRQGK